MSHQIHHYVPAFLLREWESGPEQKLTQFRWLPTGALEARQFRAKSVAKIDGLYGLSAQVPDRNTVERDFMTKHVDDPASVVHQKLLADGAQALNNDERRCWARFIISLIMRSPEKVKEAKESGAFQLRKELAKPSPEYEDIKARNSKIQHETALDFTETELKHVFDDIGPWILPKLIQDPLLNHKLFISTWGVYDSSGSSVDLLIADYPVSYEGAMASSYCVSLPLSPTKLFVSFHGLDIEARLNSVAPSELVKVMNRVSVYSAREFVYATNARQQALVLKRLRKPANTESSSDDLGRPGIEEMSSRA